MPHLQCENIETDVIIFKKGEIIDVPCHLKHKTKGSKWHWKPQPKRKHKGQVCKWQPDGKHHPRKIARRFDCDYEIIIILNPWVRCCTALAFATVPLALCAVRSCACPVPACLPPLPPTALPARCMQIHGRRHCDVEEIIYIPCEKKCDKSEKKWHHDEDKYDCGALGAALGPPCCTACCCMYRCSRACLLSLARATLACMRGCCAGLLLHSLPLPASAVLTAAPQCPALPSPRPHPTLHPACAADFERRHPARPHWPKCWNDCCPGDWKPRVWDRDCEEHRWPRFPVVPIWCLPPKPDCGDNVEWICDPSREDGWNGKPVYPEWGTGCYDQCDSNWNWDGHNDWHGKWDFIFGPGAWRCKSVRV